MVKKNNHSQEGTKRPEFHYSSLRKFFWDEKELFNNPTPENMNKLYWDLLNLNDAYLPLYQRKIRSNLLVKLGTESGIIKDNFGRPYNESRR
jgi:hypothetical protein